MEVKINIDDYTVEKMYDSCCSSVACHNCKCEVLPNEDYAGCYTKYREVFFKSEIQSKISKLLELIE